MGELAVVAGLLPVVAEDACAGELGDLDLGLAGAVGAHQAHVLSRPQAPRVQHRLQPRGHRHEQVGRERLLPRARGARADAPRSLGRPARVDVPEEHVAPPGDERRRRGRAVDACADDRGRGRVRLAERLRRQHRGRPRPQRGHGGRVEHGDQPPVGGVRDEHDAGHRRQAPCRVAREGGDPLEDGVAGPERRHGAEVPRRVGGDVHLRGHRPLAAGVGDEGGADGLHRARGRDRLADLGSGQERDHGRKPMRP